MKKVTRNEFYDRVGKLNVTVSAIGDAKNRVDFKLNGLVIGYVQNILNEFGRTKYPVESEYFLN